MEIVFRREPGEVYSVFMSLFMAYNIDYYHDFTKKMGMEIDEKILKDYEFIKEWLRG